MQDVPDNARHELKFVASPLMRAEVEHWVRTHPAGFFSPYPPRRVNNVYFDNFDHFAYEENLVGASRRTKVRLRWYGEAWRSERSTLEMKRRRNALGWKISHPGGPLDLTKGTWRQIRARLRARLPPDGRVWLDANPAAVLINRYDRLYFETRDRRVRLTLDSEQKVYGQRGIGKPNLTRPANLPATLVVECKFDAADRRLGERVIQGIRLRVSRNSKYVIGVQSIHR